MEYWLGKKNKIKCCNSLVLGPAFKTRLIRKVQTRVFLVFHLFRMTAFRSVCAAAPPPPAATSVCEEQRRRRGLPFSQRGRPAQGRRPRWRPSPWRIYLQQQQQDCLVGIRTVEVWRKCKDVAERCDVKSLRWFIGRLERYLSRNRVNWVEKTVTTAALLWKKKPNDFEIKYKSVSVVYN